MAYALANAIMLNCGGLSMDFNQILKSVRKELNITQEQLAQGLSISFSTVAASKAVTNNTVTLLLCVSIIDLLSNWRIGRWNIHYSFK